MRTDTMLAVAAGLALSAGGAFAAPIVTDHGMGITTFFGQDIPSGGNPYPLLTDGSRPNAHGADVLFQAQLPGMPLFESFEGFAFAPDANTPANNTTFPFLNSNAPGPINFGPAGTATIDTAAMMGATAGVVSRQGTVSTGGGGATEFERGRYAAFGDNYLRANAADLMLTFSIPQRAFGFWGVDIGDFGGTLELMLQGGAVLTFDIDATSDQKEDSGSVLFWGVTVQEPGMTFTGIRFRNTNFDGSLRDDIFAFDHFTVSTQVFIPPLPTTVGLGMAGFGALAFGMRRRSC